MADASTQLMQCMEVWGGNQIVDSGVVMSGLDAWVYSKPFGQADGGGDVYYVSSCATGRITRLLLADVSGHGTAVCDIAGQLRALMRRYVNHLDQTHFVRSMNQQFAAMSDAGCFATALVTTFFAPTNYLSLCNAGHPPPLYYNARSRQWTFLERGESSLAGVANIPLGILDLADYEAFEVRLGVGDLVLCYTDSLIEARTKSGDLLGQAGLLELVKTASVKEPATLIAGVLRCIVDKIGAEICDDDVTVLLFRANGTRPRLPLKTRLLAPLRVIGGLVESIRRGDRSFPLPDFNLANIGGAVFHPLNRLWAGKRIS